MTEYVPVEDMGFDGINPVIFGYEDCEPRHFFGPAIRTYWLIHYVVSGKGIYRCNNREYQLSKGDIFVISPFSETYYEADNDNPWSYIWIGFTCTMDKLPTRLPCTMKIPEALPIFYDMKKCTAMENGKSAFLCAKLWEFFSIISEARPTDNNPVAKAINIIKSNYMNPITIEEIAKKVNLERTYFSSLFKSRTGVSPGKYLMDYRLGIAAELMIKKDAGIGVASASVGYNDIYNFSKMFKKHFGLSPARYVKLHKG